MDRLLAGTLYEYLMKLNDILYERGAESLAEKVHFASRFASGSTTELYAESRNALKEVLLEHNDVLSGEEVQELKNIIEGINYEFDRIGGA